MFRSRRTRTGYCSNQETKVQYVSTSIVPPHAPVYTALFCFPRCCEDKQNINFRQSQWPAIFSQLLTLKLKFNRSHDSLLSVRRWLKGLSWKFKPHRTIENGLVDEYEFS